MTRLATAIILQLFASLAIIGVCDGYKVLVSVPKFGYSHMNFMGKMADILVDAGHDVTMLMPLIIPDIPSNGTAKAKVVHVAQADGLNEFFAAEASSMNQLWSAATDSYVGILWSTHLLGHASYLTTKKLLADDNLIEWLKSERFEIGITELFDYSGMAIFHKIGLENIIGAHTTSVFEGTLLSTGAPILPSYVPGSQSWSQPGISFMARMNNFLMTYVSYLFQQNLISYTQKAINEAYGPQPPNLWKMQANITWFVVNSDPLFDFPKSLPANIVEIAGIGVSEPKPLDKYWNEVLNRRKKNVLVSFGSIAKSSTMPAEAKAAFLGALATLKDVTFIWKTDDTDAQVAEYPNNVVGTKWMPQNDLLADKRITMFLTHGGAGSLLESATKGVPLVVVPIFGDQMRNAQIAVRYGMGLLFEKGELANGQKLAKVLSEVLTNKSYKNAALELADVLRAQKELASPSEKLEHVVEMAGRFGRMWRWHADGRQLYLFQYFSLDVILLFVVVSVVAAAAFAAVVRAFCVRRALDNSRSQKLKRN